MESKFRSQNWKETLRATKGIEEVDTFTPLMLHLLSFPKNISRSMLKRNFCHPVSCKMKDFDVVSINNSAATVILSLTTEFHLIAYWASDHFDSSYWSWELASLVEAPWCDISRAVLHTNRRSSAPTLVGISILYLQGGREERQEITRT